MFVMFVDRLEYDGELVQEAPPETASTEGDTYYKLINYARVIDGRPFVFDSIDARLDYQHRSQIYGTRVAERLG